MGKRYNIPAHALRGFHGRASRVWEARGDVIISDKSWMVRTTAHPQVFGVGYEASDEGPILGQMRDGVSHRWVTAAAGPENQWVRGTERIMDTFGTWFGETLVVRDMLGPVRRVWPAKATHAGQEFCLYAHSGKRSQRRVFVAERLGGMVADRPLLIDPAILARFAKACGQENGEDVVSAHGDELVMFTHDALQAEGTGGEGEAVTGAVLVARPVTLQVLGVLMPCRWN